MYRVLASCVVGPAMRAYAYAYIAGRMRLGGFVCPD
jgi:hypothetical protein